MCFVLGLRLSPCDHSFVVILQLLLNMNFSSRTTSLDVQRNLEANVEKRTKDTYGPPPGKRLIIFVDDMNMPQVRIFHGRKSLEEQYAMLESDWT